MSDGFEVSVPLQVRFRDLDALGHVNNAVYLSYLEMARVQYFREMLPDQTVTTRAFDFIIARVEIDYLAAASMEEELVCHIGLVEVGRRSFVYEYLLESVTTGEAKARARSVQVTYDYVKGEPTEVAPEMVARVENMRRLKGLTSPMRKGGDQ